MTAPAVFAAAATPPAAAAKDPTASWRPRKRELEALRVVAATLEQQFSALRVTRVSVPTLAAKEDAIRHKRQRLRAEEENRRLRTALYVQSRFVRRLRLCFPHAPGASVDGNWCDYVHCYTRLPRDAAVRCAELVGVTSEPRLRYAMETLLVDTQSLSFAKPTIRVSSTPLANGLSTNTVAAYALYTTDVSRALRAACVAIRDIAGVWPQYECTDLARTLVDANASAACRLQYGVDTVRYKSSRADEEAELVVQTRVTTFYTALDDCGMLMWDFIDEDDLHPWDDDVDVMRSAIGGCLFRVEMCEDGEPRVVCRTVCSKKYLWRREEGAAPSQRVAQFLSTFQTTTRPNGEVFKEIITQQVAEEAMLLGIAQSAC